MEMRAETPTRLYLPYADDNVRSFLTFEDRSTGFIISKMKRNYQWKKNDPVGFESRMKELKSQTHRSVLFQDEKGRPYTYTGLADDLRQRFGWSLVGMIPDPIQYAAMPWNKQPNEMYYYQKEAVLALIAVKHGAIELPTGSGKTLCLINLVKNLPTRSLIVAPSRNITNAIYDQFVDAFGQRYVGKYGDGSKKLGKLFTVATSDSIANVERGSEAWEWFSGCNNLIWDEAHTTPAETLEQVVMGVCEKAQNRFFVSATQIRTDGSGMILKGITGPIVYRKGFSELVNEGYLAPQIFNMIEVPSNGYASRLDAKEETRIQLFGNPVVNSMAADIANWSVMQANRPTVIIIEEFKQFLMLKNHLKCSYAFIHGGIDKENRKVIPEEFWDIDRDQIIADFNSGKITCLIGTAAIATGVDLKPTACNIYLQGGTSEIKVRQAIGRGTRINPGKKDCLNFDFKVMGSKILERHADTRMGIYSQMGKVVVHSGRR